jgi:hypothetical protein
VNCRTVSIICVLLMALLPRAFAQLQVGSNLNMRLNGTGAFGYTGGYGDLTGSEHGLTWGGVGTLTGSYYSPNFLSFNFSPFLNQSRENSNFQSISNTSGFTSGAALFSGSHFPVTVNFSDTYNGQGNFAVPGVADFTTHGDSQAFGIGWILNLPNLPTLSLSFQNGHNASTVYGTDTNATSNFHTFTAQANYSWAGFLLNGGYKYSASQAEVPQLFTNQPTATSDSSGTSLNFGIGHKLPLNGAISAAVSRSGSTSQFEGINFGTTTVDTASGGISFVPLRNLNMGATTQYTDNLAGLLNQTIISAGGLPQPGILEQQSTHSLDVTTYTTYTLPALHTTLMGSAEHRDQVFEGSSIGSDTYTGTATYANSLLGGFVSATGGVNRNTVSTNNESTLGLISSVNYSRRIRGWDVSVGGNYTQNTQTLLVAYTTTGYGYNGTLGRRLSRRSHFGASASGSKNTVSNQPGSGTFNQAYSTGLNWRWIGLSGNYSKFSGNAIQTVGGLTPTPLPLPIVTPTEVIFYNGNAYSAAISINPARRLTLTGSYAKATSDTLSSAITSHNQSKSINFYGQYQFRQMYFNAGYSRLQQSFSGAGFPPSLLGSYYFGISRWFNIF